MAPPGTRLIVHDKPRNITSWCHHVTPDWYIDPSLDHYRCMQCYMNANDTVCITDTIKYTPKEFDFPKTTPENYLQQAIGYIIQIMQDPPKTLPFKYYVDTTKNVINQIAYILQQSTAQPCL